MSDEESNEEGSNEEEEEEEDEEENGSEEGEEENDVDKQELKSSLIQKDLQYIRDVFGYIDRTSQRISETKKLRDDVQAIQQQQLFRPSQNNPFQGPSPHPVSWSNYENLTDVERAELLERALQVLAQDELPTNNRNFR